MRRVPRGENGSAWIFQDPAHQPHLRCTGGDQLVPKRPRKKPPSILSEAVARKRDQSYLLWPKGRHPPPEKANRRWPIRRNFRAGMPPQPTRVRYIASRDFFAPNRNLNHSPRRADHGAQTCPVHGARSSRLIQTGLGASKQTNRAPPVMLVTHRL